MKSSLKQLRKLIRESLLAESVCPSCGNKDAYVGMNSVECPDKNCTHFSQKQLDSIKVSPALGENDINSLLDEIHSIVHDEVGDDNAVHTILTSLDVSSDGADAFESALHRLSDIYSEATNSPEEHNESDWNEYATIINNVLNQIEPGLSIDDAGVYFPREQWEDGLGLN